MPYAVWIELADPQPADTDGTYEMARAQVPRLISNLIEAGWDVLEVRAGDGESVDLGAAEEGPRELLDVRVLGHPDGVLIGLAVDSERLDEALAVGLSLADHLVAAAPVLLDWSVDGLRADRLEAPAITGEWLPNLRRRQPRFPVAEHLPWDLRKLAAQYLIAGAVQDLRDPTGRSRTVDAADVVAGAVTEHPWGRDLAGALGGLLVAAGRVEMATGEQRRLVGRGGGDRGLAQALLDAVRAEAGEPDGDHENGDSMRGHVLVERFMAENDLRWNRVDESLDPRADEERSQDQLRALLWAGLRVLATLTPELPDSRSPWLWLAALDGGDVDPVARVYADRDGERLQLSEQDADAQLAAAAAAHLLVRAALLGDDRVGDIPEGAEEPLHHVAYNTLLMLGTDAIRAAGPVVPGDVLSALEDIAAENEAAYDDLHSALEEAMVAETVLAIVSAAAEHAGGDRSERVARELFHHPGELACVLIDVLDEEQIDTALRMRVLAGAATIDPGMAGLVAADLPALSSGDPRDEPALRSSSFTWWERAVRRHGLPSDPPDCPEPGASLLRGVPPPADAPIATSVIAVAQAVSALSIASGDADLPFEVFSPS